MEKIVRIKSQGPLQQRNWTNPRTNESILISSVEFLLTDGIDTFFAQATGTLAQALQPLDKSVLHTVQCHISHRTFERQDGSIGHENNIYIDRIV